MCSHTNEITPLPCILFQRYRNSSSRLPLPRLENSLLCKMEISVPLSIPLMTRPPLCYCRACLCLLFADVLSDCCVCGCFTNSGPLGKFPLLAHVSSLHTVTTRSLSDRNPILTHTRMQMLICDSHALAHRYFYTRKSALTPFYGELRCTTKASGALDCFSPLRLLRTEMEIKQKVS